MDTSGSPLPPLNTPDKKVDEDGFEEDETKSAKKRREKDEKKAKLKADKQAELDYAKQQGLVDKDGNNTSPPKGNRGRAKRKVKDAGLVSPPSAPPRTRTSSNRHDKKAADHEPNQTGADQ